LSPDEVTVYLDMTTGFDPSAMKADARTCRHLPASARHEVMCRGNEDAPIPCDVPVYCDIAVDPAQTECAYSYGLNIISLDFPEGHAKLPDGGRIVVGFNMNRTPLTDIRNPKFLVPALESTEGASVGVSQFFLRNVTTMPDGCYLSMSGRLGTYASSGDTVTVLQLPPFLPPPDPDLGQLPDAGFETVVGLIPEDPFADCSSVTFEKIYAVATSMIEPQVSSQLPGAISDSGLPNNALKGLLLSRVDRDLVEGASYEDRWWRIYAPPGTAPISIPTELSPFSVGQEVWVTPWASSFNVPFDYDLFLPDQILGPKAAYSEDSWAVIVP
jgi:hypothetical protein